MKHTCCFGELLIRYSPHLQGEWIRSQSMQTYIGGAELNVAYALANWAMPVKYITAIPDHYLSKEIIEQLTKANIQTDGTLFNGERIGVYYLPQGADLKHAGVIYDRANSAFANLKEGMFDWTAILKDAGWFHFSAISPALNASAAAVCLEAVKQAKQMGLTVSVDLNYRSLLWRYGQSPVEVMRTFMPYCDVVMGNIWSAATLLGTPLNSALLTNNHQDSFVSAAEQSANHIMQTFPNVQIVANTFRFTNEANVDYYATWHDQSGTTVSDLYTTNHVVDKVGSGDCFMSGLIRGIQLNQSNAYIINYAATAAVGKLQEYGDHTRQTVAEIEAKMKSYD